jgi:1-acyl-sn-glycerol-3-phosphate acyltransferase
VGPFFQSLYYWITQTCLRVYFLVYHRYWSRHAGKFPVTGPLIIASNHTTMLDPPLLSVVCGRRKLRFMAKKQLFENAVVGFLLRNLGAYPIDRESQGDKKAIVETIRLLKEGNAVVIFPEGTRSPDGRLKEFQQGAMRIALAVPGCKIAPVYVRGGFESYGMGRVLPIPCKISVSMGELLDPSAVDATMDKKAHADELGRLLESRLKALEEAAYNSVASVENPNRP